MLICIGLASIRMADATSAKICSKPVGCYHPHPPSPFIVITQPKADIHFTVPQWLEG